MIYENDIPKKKAHILLADDDTDDCFLFGDALREMKIPVQLTTVYNGEQLMLLLNASEQLPDILFLDLNMPRKNGFESLSEIKSNPRLRHLCVVVISTSLEKNVVHMLQKSGARHCIRKPNDFVKFRQLIGRALNLTVYASASNHSADNVPTSEDCFVLS